MNTANLIEQLTWATVEISNPSGKIDTTRVTEVLSAALCRAILAEEDEKRVKAAFLRTVQVIGQ